MSLLIFFASATALAVPTPRTLTQVLEEQGYQALQLRPSATGHLHTSGALGDRLVEVLVDTGASNTVIDLALARELGLALTPVRERGAGVGETTVAVDRVAGAKFSVGGLRVEGDVFAMDLSTINAALAARGVPPFQAVLGGDSMRKLDAILLYRENTLLLRVP
jgi:predicted aspartyl protease